MQIAADGVKVMTQSQHLRLLRPFNLFQWPISLHRNRMFLSRYEGDRSKQSWQYSWVNEILELDQYLESATNDFER